MIRAAAIFLAALAFITLYCPVKCWLGLPVTYCTCGR